VGLKDINQTSIIQLYNSIIRSITDYAAVLFENVSDRSKDKIETIQYHSMLQILKKIPETSNTEMREQLGIDTLSNRHNKLNEKYLEKSLQNNQLIIDLYNEHRQFRKDHNITDQKFNV